VNFIIIIIKGADYQSMPCRSHVPSACMTVGMTVGMAASWNRQVPQALETLPEGATSGVLCFVGLRGFMTGNEFWERCLLLLAAPSELPTDRPYSPVPWRVMHGYTLVQIACFAACWLVSVRG
jgi:hypothetical protein